MDDLTELQSRVAAAQERLQQSAEEERRYGLRLNDIVSIVEGSLSRQRSEVENLKDEITKLKDEVDTHKSAVDKLKDDVEKHTSAIERHKSEAERQKHEAERQKEEIETHKGEALELRTMVGKLSSERDEVKGGLIQAHNALSAAQARLGQREMQNEQLRRMLMELLAAVESRKGPVVHDVVRRLEGGIQTLMKQEHAQLAEMAAAAPETHPGSSASRPAAMARGRLTVVATVTKANETTGRLALAQQPSEEAEIAEAVAEEDFEEPVAEPENEPESLSDVAMSEAGDIVTDPDKAKVETPADPQEQELVNALLDAERKLIEAEALGGAANANSPVAEIIRRISQRTREINEQAPQS